MALTSTSSAIATSTIGVSPYLREMMVKELLKRVKPKLLHVKDAKRHSLKQGEGNTLQMRRRNRIVPASASAYQLTEGVTPAPLTPSLDVIRVTPLPYGGWIDSTDVLEELTFDGMAPDIEDLGDFLGEVLDLAVRDDLVTGTNVIYAGQTSRAAITSSNTLGDTELKKATAALRNLNVEPFPDGTYHAIMPSLAIYDLFGTDGWKVKSEQQQARDIEMARLGNLWGIKFMDTSLAKKFAAAGFSNIDVYCTLVYGPGAFGAGDIPGLNQDVIVKPVTSGGADNPLNQRGSRGTKATIASKILDDKRIVRIEHAIGYSGF